MLGDDVLAAHEAEPMPCDRDGLGFPADQVHLDPRLRRVPYRAMHELRELEVRVVGGVDVGEHVEIELGGHTFAIVVRAKQLVAICVRIRAEEDQRVRPRELRELAEELPRFVGFEVADRRAWKEHDGGAGRPLGDRQDESLRVVAEHRQDFERGERDIQRGRRLGELVGGDIDRHVGRRAIERREQHPGLATRTTARLDHACVRPDGGRDRRQRRLEQCELGARQVVVLDGGDSLEQIRTARVVEQLARQMFDRRAEPRDHLVDHFLLASL